MEPPALFLAPEALQTSPIDVLEFVAGNSPHGLPSPHWFASKCSHWTRRLREQDLSCFAAIPTHDGRRALFELVASGLARVVISRAFALSNSTLVTLAEAAPATLFLQVNHTPNSMLHLNDRGGLADVREALQLSMEIPNMYFGLVSARDYRAATLQHPMAKILWTPNPGPAQIALPEGGAARNRPPWGLAIAARGSVQKNIKIQLDAIHLVASKKELTLDLFLTWPSGDHVLRDVSEYAKWLLEKRVCRLSIHNFLDQPSFLRAVYNDCDCFLNVTLDEADSVVALEVMSLGIPAVCSHAVPYSPLVANPLDPCEIAQAICAALSDNSRYRVTAAAAVAHHISIVDRQFFGTITALVGGRTPPD